MGADEKEIPFEFYMPVDPAGLNDTRILNLFKFFFSFRRIFFSFSFVYIEYHRPFGVCVCTMRNSKAATTQNDIVGDCTQTVHRNQTHGGEFLF